MKARNLGYFACAWETAKHFSLLSIILIAQHDSSALNLPIPPSHPPTGQMAFFFFSFFFKLWALAPLLHHTKPLRWLAGVRSRGRQMDPEVAEQIKRIRRSLFTDASKLLMTPSFKTSVPPPTHKQLSLTDGGVLCTRVCVRRITYRLSQIERNSRGAFASYMLDPVVCYLYIFAS